MFKSAADATRLQAYFQKNGLNEVFAEWHGRLIFTITAQRAKRHQYIGAIARFIIEVKRNEWLDRTLLKKYHYENTEERSQIIDIAGQILSGEREEAAAFAGELRENELVYEAAESLADYEGAVLFDSFLTFRLREYHERLGILLDAAIDEYKMEQEYQMFIHMLRNYLQERSPRKQTIHLYLDGQLSFYDENLTELKKEDLRDIMDRRLFSNHPVYIDSAVIAPLLSLAPKKIYVYTDQEDQALVRTLCNIFEERLVTFPCLHFHILRKSHAD